MTTNTPTGPADLAWPHRAVSRHFKVFHRFPEWAWHNGQARCHLLADDDTVVSIYADRVDGFFFEPVRPLTGDGFVVLLVAVSYLEANEQYREGRRSAANETSLFFLRALKRVFTEIDDADAKIIYQAVRNGLFHNGMTKREVALSPNAPQPIERTGRLLIVNPNRFLERIEAAFRDYIGDLHAGRQPQLEQFLRLWRSDQG